LAEQAARELQADSRWLPFKIHPDTPPEGAPKPFSPEEWPQVRERLKVYGLFLIVFVNS
jgi:hypothetical protein